MADQKLSTTHTVRKAIDSPQQSESAFTSGAYNKVCLNLSSQTPHKHSDDAGRSTGEDASWGLGQACR